MSYPALTLGANSGNPDRERSLDDGTIGFT